MTNPSRESLNALGGDIRSELRRLERLTEEVAQALQRVNDNPADKHLYYESIALKLQNFYTGCERIFQFVATELNGGLPSGSDWHRRALSRAQSTYAERPAIIAESTARALEPYLGFRHVARNAYSFDLDLERVDQLAHKQRDIFTQFEADTHRFLNWLAELSERADE